MDLEKYPSSLRDEPARIARARNLIESHLGTTSLRGEPAHFQGMWSETFIITTENSQKAVVQFRAKPLNITPFQRARKLLGQYCPIIELLHDEELEDAGFFPVYMSYIHGHTWCDDPQQSTKPEFNVSVMKSLGGVLALCVVADEDHGLSKDEVIRKEVIQKLDKRLLSDRKEIDPFRDLIRDLRRQAATCGLEKLPLFQSHMDLNDMNIMVTEEGRVTGIVDWESSPLPQPFGMGLHRIHDLAGQFIKQVYHQRDEYDDMERSFWDALLSALSDNHRQVIMDNLEAVEVAIKIGTVLWTFDFDSGAEYINPAVLAALPQFLTYRIPKLRGQDSAYADPPYIGAGVEEGTISQLR